MHVTNATSETGKVTTRSVSGRKDSERGFSDPYEGKLAKRLSDTERPPRALK